MLFFFLKLGACLPRPRPPNMHLVNGTGNSPSLEQPTLE